MEDKTVKVYQGIVTEEEEELSLLEICKYSNLEQDYIIELVNEGILEPLGSKLNEWHFEFTSLERIQKVSRLQQDLDLNLAGAALAIHLLERIEKLEQTIQRMKFTGSGGTLRTAFTL